MFRGLFYAGLFLSGQLFSLHTKTDEGDWFIYSPKPVLVSDKPKASDPSNTVENLSKLCEKAERKWNGATTNEQKGELAQQIFESVDSSYLISVIDQILGTDELLEKVRESSYKNATGFVKIVLAKGDQENGWKARLHIWKNDTTKEFPHNHKWDFYSKILSGYLKQDVYSFHENGENFHIREPSSLLAPLDSGKKRCPCRDEYELSKKGDQKTINLTVNSTNRIVNTESYFFPNQFIHTIEPSQTGAISFVFTSSAVKENSEVYVPNSRIKEDLTKFAPGFTKEEIKQELLKAKSILKQLSIKERYLPEVISKTHQYFESFDPLYSNPLWRNEVKDRNNNKRVIQRNELDLSFFKVSSDHMGRILIGGKQIDPSKEYIFVYMEEGIYAAIKDFFHKEPSLICHSSFTNYGNCLSAGVFHFNKNGDLDMIEAYSGHYQPSTLQMKYASDYLDSIGVEVKYAKIITYKDRT